MAIRKSRQQWEVGRIVQVGFMRSLQVVEGPIPVKDGLPDIYRLRASNGQLYEFCPHNGLSKVI